ncbi:MAG: thioredoxin domain-containing protein [Acidobacteria bacterium]|nr:thioredoxin domain-containing protein [Acidobacteriota bacterium]
MIASLATGAAILDEPWYRDAAGGAAEFVLSKMRRDGRLLRSYRNGKAHLMAYIDDYAFLIEGLIALYEITGELRWVNETERLTETAIQYYWDESDGGFFFTASDHEQLIVRSKVATDNAIPSGNSVMVMNLLKLHLLLGRTDLRDKATAILGLYSGTARQNPFAHERLLSGIEAWHEGFQEIAIVGPLDNPQTEELLRAIYSSYLPNKIVALLDPAWPDAAEITRCVPLLADKKMLDGKPTAYVCRNYACQAPATDVATLRQQLGSI